MEYPNIKSRSFQMAKAVKRMNAQPHRNSYRQMPFDYTDEGQTTIILSDGFDQNDQTRNVDDPILRKIRDAEPYQVAGYIHYVEQHFRTLIDPTASDAYPLFDALTQLYGSKTNLPVLITVGEQFKTAAKDVRGSWVNNVNLLTNYLDRISSLPDLPNLSSAWRFIHKGCRPQHLAAALACILDLNTVAIQQEGSGPVWIDSPRTKYIQQIKVSWMNSWISCVSFGDKGVARNKWFETRCPLDWKTIHNWKSLPQLVEDDEADQALEVLSDIGAVSDSS
jgi:hypothetical protein